MFSEEDLYYEWNMFNQKDTKQLGDEEPFNLPTKLDTIKCRKRNILNFENITSKFGEKTLLFLIFNCIPHSTVCIIIYAH